MSVPPREPASRTSEAGDGPAAASHGLLRRGLDVYQVVEREIAPKLPRPVRNAWRRLLGRPPLGTRPAVQSARSGVEHGGAGLAESADVLAYDVICLPIIAWDFRFQRPQQLMREMAGAGHRVFWVNPHGLRDGERLLPQAGGPSLAEWRERIFDVRLAALRARDHFKDALAPADTIALLESLDRLRTELGVVSAVLVVQLPFWTALAIAAAERFGWRIVYDCMDEHSGFSSNTPAMLATEEELLRRSNAVVVTSKKLLERAALGGRSAELIPNACEFRHFAVAARAASPATDANRRPVIGYFGAISEWFDFDLLRHAVSEHPEWDFVLIGSTWASGSHADLEAKPNVRFLGEQPYDALPAHLRAMDVCVIPFHITPLTAATNPVKIYEYFAAGKPVVASPLAELGAMGDLVEIAATPEEFTAAIGRALHDTSPERRAARIDFARRNDWRARGLAFDAACRRTFPLASVVVVTWNNLDLTKRCIASVLADESWPRFEIVIVDNGSTDGTPAFLRALATRESRVRIELNAENRGFAPANNQGIALSSGEYVVLLNNDTEVTRGWLARLIRALEEDPRLGLVGPVTNSVYNEAREDVSAADLANLSRFADRWGRDHRAELYPIKMLAMFCVAARRSVLDEIGPLDERFRIGMLEDDDYSHRVRLAGYRIACLEEVFVYHAGQASFQKLRNKDALQIENQRKFEEKWSTRWRPYASSRAINRRIRDEIDELALRRSGQGRVVVFLPEREWAPDEGRHLEPLATALARAGHLVFFCLDGFPTAASSGLLPLERGLFLVSAPLETFENLIAPIVVATSESEFDLSYFERPIVIHDAGRNETPVSAAGSPSGSVARRARVVLLPQSPSESAIAPPSGEAVIFLPDRLSPRPGSSFCEDDRSSEGLSRSPAWEAIARQITSC